MSDAQKIQATEELSGIMVCKIIIDKLQKFRYKTFSRNFPAILKNNNPVSNIMPLFDAEFYRHALYQSYFDERIRLSDERISLIDRGRGLPCHSLLARTRKMLNSTNFTMLVFRKGSLQNA